MGLIAENVLRNYIISQMAARFFCWLFFCCSLFQFAFVCYGSHVMKSIQYKYKYVESIDRTICARSQKTDAPHNATVLCVHYLFRTRNFAYDYSITHDGERDSLAHIRTHVHTARIYQYIIIYFPKLVCECAV